MKGRNKKGPKHGLSGMERLVKAFWDFSVKHNLGGIGQEQTYKEACMLAKKIQLAKKTKHNKRKSRKSKLQERPTTQVRGRG